MGRSTVAVAVAWIVSFAPGAGLADEPATAPSHLVLPIKTDLHKELVPGGADVFVLVDTTKALQGDSIVVGALKLEDLRHELVRHKRVGAKLHFNVFIKRADVERTEQSNVISYALIGLGHRLGFAKVTAAVAYWNEDITWLDLVESFTGKNVRIDVDEPVSKNDVAKVFPVRTPLSRFLTSGADCAVVILPSLQKDRGIIPANVLDAVTGLLDKAKLEQRNRISFYVGHVAQEDLTRLLRNFRSFAEVLGFKASSVTFR